MADHIEDARVRLECRFTESVFYRVALEAGFGRKAEDEARKIYNSWETNRIKTDSQNAWRQLPAWVRDNVLAICNGATGKV